MNLPGSTGRRYRRACTGFSLVEVLCAVLVLGIALVGLTQAITTALQSNKDSELQTTAVLFAAGMIETLRAEGGLVNGTTEGTCGAGLSQYEWTQTIGPAQIDGLYEVAVAMRGSSSGKTICELKTLLFEMPKESSYAPADKKGRSSGSKPSNRSRRS